MTSLAITFSPMVPIHRLSGAKTPDPVPSVFCECGAISGPQRPNLPRNPFGWENRIVLLIGMTCPTETPDFLILSAVLNVFLFWNRISNYRRWMNLFESDFPLSTGAPIRTAPASTADAPLFTPIVGLSPLQNEREHDTNKLSVCMP
jgi:hypothetical protein